MLTFRSLQHLPKLRGYASTLSPLIYERVANDTLERLTEYLDELPEKLPVSSEYDVSNAMGVLTVTISKDVGTYVINKQSPNLQLWLSSPLSGPKRYDLVDNKWIYSHDNETLANLLTKEFQKILGDDTIDFRNII